MIEERKERGKVGDKRYLKSYRHRLFTLKLNFK
jgi:hypothetical protein